MKKSIIKLLFLSFLLPGSISVSAQDNPFNVGFRYGYTLPMGQFASHEYTYGAYALLGSSASAEASWYPGKRLGFGASFSLSYFPIAAYYFLQDYDSADPTVQYNFIKSETYEVRTYMGGAFYRLPISKRFEASFKAMGGLCWVRSPYQFFTGTYLIGPMFHIITPAISSRFAFSGAATLNYKLFDHVVLLLESEFSYSEAKFTFWKNGMTQKEIQIIKMPLFKVQPGINITF